MNEKELRLLNIQPEIRALDGGKKMIVGYAVRWEQLSEPIWGTYREKFARGAFTESLRVRANDIFATWQHDVRETLGRSPNTLTVREDDAGLWYEITPPSWAEKYVESIERGDVRGSSFIFVASAAEYDWNADPDYVIRTVNRAELYEVSPVTMPAYPQSSAGVRSDREIAEEIQKEREKRNAQEIQAQRDYLARQKALRDMSIKFN